MSTGAIVDGVPQSCKSFSHLALIEDDYPAVSIAPLLSSSYTIDCTTATQQDVNLTLSGTEGVRTLRLWAIDSSGNISSTSKDVTVTFDASSPVVTLTSLNGGSILKGGSTATISWSAVEANPATNPITLEYSLDSGSTWATIASSVSNSGSYNWTVPAVDTASAKVRVTMVDIAGNSGSATSAGTFSIDSTAPAAPLVNLTSSAVTNDASTEFEVQDCTDVASVFTNESATAPVSSAAGWESCDTTRTYQFTISGEGSHTVRVWSKDAAGNVSATPGTYSVTLDITAPTITLNNDMSGSVLSGNSTQSPAINIKSLQFSGTDALAGLDTDDFSVEVCTTSCGVDANWSVSQAAVTMASSPQTFNWTVPYLNSATAKIRIRGRDLAGNSATSAASQAFTIDSAAPAVTSTVINDGLQYAGTAVLQVKSAVSDNYTGSASLKVRIAAANTSTLECQSSYSDSGWSAYPGENTASTFMTTPIDGLKKVCVWAKDLAGNVSIVSPVEGTLGQDTDTIIYQVGNPPAVSAFSVTRNLGGTVVTAGDAMTINWSATDTEGLANEAISFSYTTNDSTWKDIVTNQDISDANQVTWMGGLTGNPQTGSGTVTSWVAPSSGYFRVRAIARDNAGNTSVAALSQVFNSGNWTVYAGSRDRGIGGSGRAAALTIDPYTRVFAVDPKSGDIYAVDNAQGIVKLSTTTGIVSMFLRNGTNNLPDNGTLTSASRAPIGTETDLVFDTSGKLYLQINHPTDSRLAIQYQIDVQTNSVRRYLGGGTSSDIADGALNLALARQSVGFDEDLSMYFYVWCGGSPVDIRTSGLKILKLTQNSDGSAGALSHVAGNCNRMEPSTFGVAASTSPIGPASGNSFYPSAGSITVWNRGANIYVSRYGNNSFKIINGNIHSATFTSWFRTRWLVYNPNDQKLYKSNSTGGISRVTPNLAGNGGEAEQIWFTANSTAAGCSQDGAAIASLCGVFDIRPVLLGDKFFFGEGAVSNGITNYSVRYFDDDNKIRTLLGASPLYGINLDRRLARGEFSGIYYKTSAEPNQTAFPAGLYFMERNGVVMGYIDPATDKMSVLLGNQTRHQSLMPANGQTMSPDVPLGPAYSGGVGHALAFDSDGLPWFRASNHLFSVDTNKVLVQRTAGSKYWHDLAEGENPVNSRPHVHMTTQNLVLKNQGLFAVGAAYVELASSTDPYVSIKYLNFGAGSTSTVLGGVEKYSNSPAASADAAAGTLLTKNLWYTCAIQSNCFSVYDSAGDKLYFSENTKIRIISTPNDTAASTLTTARTHVRVVKNLSLRPDGKQLWFTDSANYLICHDISSGKSWCDGTTNHFQAAASAGFSITTGANQITWKDDSTLFLSTYRGEILEYTLPTTP